MGFPELLGRATSPTKIVFVPDPLQHSPSAKSYRLKFYDECAEPGTSRTRVAPREGELAEHRDQHAGDTGPPRAPHQRGKALASGPPEEVTFGVAFA